MKSRVLFYSSVSNKSLFNTQKFFQIDIDLLKSNKNIVLLSNKIFDSLLFWRYDYVYIYFYTWGVFVALFAKLFFKKVYFTGGIDNLDKKYTPKMTYIKQIILFKLCYILSDKCILVSLSDEYNVKRIFKGKCSKKLSLSFHTIDVLKFTNLDLIEKKDIFTSIVCMERIENVIRKGLDQALEIFKYLSSREEFNNSLFYIIGTEGEGSEYLRKLSDSLGIKEKVIFTGKIEEEKKIRILKQSKYYFQMSKYEGFGIAAIEALASKNIVIHSGNGELQYTMKDYGIKTNIDMEKEQLLNSIYRELQDFNYNKLNDAQKYVEYNFSNDQRKKDLKYILETNV